MAIKLGNYVSTTLSAALTAAATSATVVDASDFPTIVAGEFFYLTLVDAASAGMVAANPIQREIVEVTAVSGNTLTVVRARDGTTAQAFAIGSFAELRFNAQAGYDLTSPFAANGSVVDGLSVAYNRTRAAAGQVLKFGATDAAIPVGVISNALDYPLLYLDGQGQGALRVQTLFGWVGPTVVAPDNIVSWSINNVWTRVLIASPTFTFVDPVGTNGYYELTLIVVQDATGNWQITWPAGIEWEGGSPLQPLATASRSTVFTFRVSLVLGVVTYYGSKIEY